MKCCCCPFRAGHVHLRGCVCVCVRPSILSVLLLANQVGLPARCLLCPPVWRLSRCSQAAAAAAAVGARESQRIDQQGCRTDERKGSVGLSKSPHHCFPPIIHPSRLQTLLFDKVCHKLHRSDKKKKNLLSLMSQRVASLMPDEPPSPPSSPSLTLQPPNVEDQTWSFTHRSNMLFLDGYTEIFIMMGFQPVFLMIVHQWLMCAVTFSVIWWLLLDCDVSAPPFVILIRVWILARTMGTFNYRFKCLTRDGD